MNTADKRLDALRAEIDELWDGPLDDGPFMTEARLRSILEKMVEFVEALEKKLKRNTPVT